MKLGSAQLGDLQLGGSSETVYAVGQVTLSGSATVQRSGIEAYGNGTVSVSGRAHVSNASRTAGAHGSLSVSGAAEIRQDGYAVASGTLPVFGSATVATTPSFRGAHPELVQTVSPPRWDISERDRIEGYLKRPFQTPKGPSGEYLQTDFGALVATFSEFAQGMVATRNETLGARYIDIAHGQSLDNIGKLIQVPRQTDEKDPRYRIRLKAYFRRLVGGGTIDEIRQTIALLLDCDVEEVEFDEPFHSTVAQFDITLDNTIIEDAPISTDELLAFVAGFRAAGVRVTFSVSGSFTNRSLADLREGRDLGEMGYEESFYTGSLF